MGVKYRFVTAITTLLLFSAAERHFTPSEVSLNTHTPITSPFLLYSLLYGFPYPLIAAGGAVESHWVQENPVESFNTYPPEVIQNETWNFIYPTNSPVGNILPNFTETSMVMFRNKVYVLGGRNTTHVFRSVWRSKDGGKHWDYAANVSSFGYRFGHVVTSSADNIFLFGGYMCNDTKLRSYTEGCVLKNDVWRSSDGENYHKIYEGVPNTPRTGFRVVSSEGQLVLMGGFDPHNSKYCDDIWESSSRGEKWNQIKPAPSWQKRADFGAVALGSHIFVFGGKGSSGFFSDVWRTDKQGLGQWKLVTRGAAWRPRASFVSLASSQYMWLIGGSNGSREMEDVWEATDGINWKRRTTLISRNASAILSVVPGNSTFPLVLASRYNISQADLAGSASTLRNTSLMFQGTLNLLCSENGVVCSGHGNCSDKSDLRKQFVPSVTQINPVCNCTFRYTGDKCSKGSCGAYNCKHGVCNTKENGSLILCECNPGWNGTECDAPICDPKCVHGTCDKPYGCDCEEHWFGAHCDVYKSTLWRIGHYISVHGSAWFTTIGCIAGVGLLTYGLVMNQVLRNPARLRRRKHSGKHGMHMWDDSVLYGTFGD
eukprot:gb/GECG01009215.1/.p1 GENE.gb/GECG01009215.1/~~gb/GECG01009215.1/.p1  ORF type:complete len:599 (+),score=36.09 gb/GECG01009215.1/:1-1797(+)